MPLKRRADDPIEWLDRAKSNLAMAKAGTIITSVHFEDPCFEAQQAAEKAIKAVLLHRGIRFPYTHDLGDLLDLIRKTGEAIPRAVRDADRLTRFAVTTRYPGLGERVTREEYKRALKMAEAVVGWAEKLLARPSKRKKKP